MGGVAASVAAPGWPRPTRRPPSGSAAPGRSQDRTAGQDSAALKARRNVRETGTGYAEANEATVDYTNTRRALFCPAYASRKLVGAGGDAAPTEPIGCDLNE